MMMASMMGAVAFQKGLGIVHSLAHPLSTLLDMHHGLANALNLPQGLSFNQEVRADHFKRLANVLGLSQGEEVVQYIKTLNVDLGLPENLASCGVKEEQVDALVDLALQDFCLPSNPRQPTRSDLVDLYRSNLNT
jgi:alcohol dehydrogenase class IV